MTKFTRSELIQLFIPGTFVTHLWAFYTTFDVIPAWILYFKVGELFILLSYLFFYVFLESLAVFVLILVVGSILPSRLTQKNYIPASGIFVTGSAIIITFLRLNKFPPNIRQTYIIGLSLLLILIVFAAYIFPKIIIFTEKFLEQISSLAYVFFAIDAVSIVVVFLRTIRTNL